MKRFLSIVCFTALLTACGGTNEDGSSKSTYSSCKITNSGAMLSRDRDYDLQQCWNASGAGYSAQGDALQWCSRQVNAYISNRYTFAPSVEYAVESSYCPN